MLVLISFPENMQEGISSVKKKKRKERKSERIGSSILIKSRYIASQLAACFLAENNSFTSVDRIKEHAWIY